MVSFTRTFVPGLLALLLMSGLADAGGHDLTGRVAPDLTFSDGMNGVQRGTRLSSFRGRPVWLMFILRDCPRCKVELARAQDLHDRWGGSGLVVLIVVHRHDASSMTGFMRAKGYTFLLATDPDGRQAQAYGVQHRPASYVIGVDGRVKASNAAPDDVLRTELGRYRLQRLGAVPAGLDGVRDAVWRWDYGAALRTAEPAAAKPEATEDVKRFVTRLQAQARSELDARVALAALYVRRRQPQVGQQILDRVATHFRGTSLETAAEEARRAGR